MGRDHAFWLITTAGTTRALTNQTSFDVCTVAYSAPVPITTYPEAVGLVQLPKSGAIGIMQCAIVRAVHGPNDWQSIVYRGTAAISKTPQLESSHINVTNIKFLVLGELLFPFKSKEAYRINYMKSATMQSTGAVR